MRKTKAYHEKKHTARKQRKQAKRADARKQAASGKRTATKQERRANSIRQPVGKVSVFQSNRHARVTAQITSLRERVTMLMTDAIEEAEKAA